MFYINIMFFSTILFVILGATAFYFWERVYNWLSVVSAAIAGYIAMVNTYIQLAIQPIYKAFTREDIITTSEWLYLAGLFVFCLVVIFNTIKYKTVAM